MPNMIQSSSLFNDKGWRLPESHHRTFSKSPNWFYRTAETIPQPAVIFERAQRYLAVTGSLERFVAKLTFLRNQLSESEYLRNILGGVCVPFVLPRLEEPLDLGDTFAQILLPAVGSAFQGLHPDRHFKAVLQNNLSLAGRLDVQSESRYDRLVVAAIAGPVCGLYFPQALQEYDTASQFAQMSSLPLHPGLVLSGPLDIAAALVGFPDLLFHDQFYAPVLCLSAALHKDPRLVCCFKSYGPHLEFWCLSQMLTPSVKQVSEQWAGGLTVFTPLDS